MDLFALPMELLDAILDYVGYSDLKTLRLVNKQFSKMHAVLRSLFRSVYMVADLFYIAHCSPRDVMTSGIGPFVRHITFVPPLYARFESVQFQRIYERHHGSLHGSLGNDVPLRRSGRTKASIESRRQQPLVAQHLLAVEEHFKAGFELYIACLSIAEILLTHDVQQEAWVKTIRLFPRCTSFKFALVDYSWIGKNSRPMFPKCVIEPFASPEEIVIGCDIFTAETFSQLATNVFITCMAQAECVPESLTFNQASCHDDDDKRWEKTFGMDELNLSQLRNLTVEPYLPHDDLDDEDQLAMTRRMREDINSLLRRTSSTLETFRSSRSIELIWTGTPTALPKLRQLHLGQCGCSSDYLCKWIKACPNLEYIVLDDIDLRETISPGGRNDEPINNWQKIFDTIRDHEEVRKGRIASKYARLPTVDCLFDKDIPIESVLQKQDARELVMEARILPSSQYDLHKWIELYIRGEVDWIADPGDSFKKRRRYARVDDSEEDEDDEDDNEEVDDGQGDDEEDDNEEDDD